MMIDLSLRQVYASRWQKGSGMFRIHILEQLLVVFDICIYVSSSIMFGIQYSSKLFDFHIYISYFLVSFELMNLGI